MSGEQWREYKRLVAEGVEPPEAYGRLMPDRSLGINDRRWLRWVDHCQEKADVQAQEQDPHGCIMAVRNAPFEYVPAEEEPNPDPFDWAPEGKPERGASEYRAGSNPSLTSEASGIESCGLVSGSAPASVYLRDPEDTYGSLEERD